jgi:hypothetical protein
VSAMDELKGLASFTYSEPDVTAVASELYDSVAAEVRSKDRPDHKPIRDALGLLSLLILILILIAVLIAAQLVQECLA